jgi:ribosomal protein L11 methyltransferase
MTEPRTDPPADGGPLQLWRASFLAPAEAMPELLEPLEDLATSVSIFEDEVDEEARTTRWRVDLLFDREPEHAAIEADLAGICAPFGFAPGPLTIDVLPEEEWLRAAAIQAEPVRVGRFLVHGAAARDRLQPGQLSVQVEAGLAFGSGEHATTQACLEALDRLAGRRLAPVLDLGCGSGVLAIAAARLWRGRVLAVDNDPVAVRVAARNIAASGLSGRIRTAVSEGWSAGIVRRGGPYGLVLANILADPLIEMAPRLARHLLPRGVAVLSGFIGRDLERVLEAHRREGLRELFRIDRAPWMALVLEARAGPRRMVPQVRRR